MVFAWLSTFCFFSCVAHFGPRPTEFTSSSGVDARGTVAFGAKLDVEVDGTIATSTMIKNRGARGAAPLKTSRLGLGRCLTGGQCC